MPRIQKYQDVLKEIDQQRYAPVYCLMGEEDYYIDLIEDYILQRVLTEEQKDFNLTLFYGADTNMSEIVSAARRYPMMADHQVVIVREAQALDSNWDELSAYLQHPVPSTLLVLSYKHGVLDKRKKVAKQIEELGVIFESPQLKEAAIPDFVTHYLQQKGIGIETVNAQLIAEYVGNNLTRLSNELDKLIIGLPQGTLRVTVEHIEKNIGISKEYNLFELKNALVAKDVLKANKILKYFEENPKKNPVQPILAMLHNFYANLMVAYYAPSKTERGVAQALQLRYEWQAKEYMMGMRAYSATKVLHIVGAIRECDAKSKGFGNVSVDAIDLLRQLVFFILH